MTEGSFHKLGCDMERCPFCGGQLITCSCPYKKTGVEDLLEYGSDTRWLPRDVFEHGLNEEQQMEWEAILEEKGRVRFIWYPNLCVMCGSLWPETFHVSDEEWKQYIEMEMRKSILCRTCYDHIKAVIDVAKK